MDACSPNRPQPDRDPGELLGEVRDLLRPVLAKSELARGIVRALGALLLSEAERAAAEAGGVPAAPQRNGDAATPQDPAAAGVRPAPGLIAGPRVVTPEPSREVPLRLGDAGARVKVFGRPEEIARAHASAEDEPKPERFTPAEPIDVEVIARRCELKAEACRVYVERRAAAGDAQREPEMIARVDELIERAKQLPECFLWMVFPGRDQPDDATLGLIASWYEALAGSASLLASIDSSQPARRADLAEAMQLFAHADAGLRVALDRTWLTKPDTDQEEAHLWLRWETKVCQVMVPRFMRLDDPPELDSVGALLNQIGGMRQEFEERARRSTSTGRHLNRARYHALQLATGRSSDPAHDWRRIEEALAQLESLGLPPQHARVAAMVAELAESGAAPHSECARARAALAAALLSGAAPEGESATTDREWSDRVLQVRELLEGRRVVVIGGEPRAEAADRLREAFALAGVDWVPLTEHGSGAPMRAPITHPDSALVLVLIKFAGHLHVDEAREYGRQAGKPVVLLQAGYNPEQVAFAVLAQASQQLRPAG